MAGSGIGQPSSREAHLSTQRARVAHRFLTVAALVPVVEDGEAYICGPTSHNYGGTDTGAAGEAVHEQNIFTDRVVSRRLKMKAAFYYTLW